MVGDSHYTLFLLAQDAYWAVVVDNWNPDWSGYTLVGFDSMYSKYRVEHDIWKILQYLYGKFCWAYIFQHKKIRVIDGIISRQRDLINCGMYLCAGVNNLAFDNWNFGEKWVTPEASESTRTLLNNQLRDYLESLEPETTVRMQTHHSKKHPIYEDDEP